MNELIDRLLKIPEFQQFEKSLDPLSDITLIEDLRKKLDQEGDKEAVEVLSWEIQAHHLTLNASYRRDKTPSNVFSPMMEMQDKDGKLVVYPDFSKFSDKMLDYYQIRVQNTINSSLKARFADILWVKEKDYKSAQIGIEAYLESAEKLFENEQYIYFTQQFERSVRLCLEINSMVWLSKLYEKSKLFLGKLELNKEYRWIIDILSVLVHIPLNKIDIDYGLIVSMAERGYQWALVGQTMNDAIVVHFLRIKEEAYKKQGDTTRAKECRVEAARYYEKIGRGAMENKQFMKASHFLGICLQRFISSGEYSDKVEEIKKLLKECNENSAKYEFSTVTTEVKIPRGEIDKLLESLKEKGIEEILSFVARNNGFLCLIQNANKQAEESIKKYPLQHLMNAVIQDKRGNIVEILDTPEKKFKKALYQTLDFHYIFLAKWYLMPIFDLLKNEKRCDAVAIKDFLSKSDFFDEDTLLFLENGFRQYLEENHVASIHILTFRIEAILRRVLHRLGIPTSSTRDGKTQEKNIEGILMEGEIRSGLGEDIATYLEWLLIDKLGFNLRHNVAHGLLEYNDFSKAINLLVIYALLLFTRFSFNKSEQSKEAGTGS